MVSRRMRTSIWAQVENSGSPPAPAACKDKSAIQLAARTLAVAAASLPCAVYRAHAPASSSTVHKIASAATFRCYFHFEPFEFYVI